MWDYHCLKHDVSEIKADFVMVLGSHDLRVAERGADLVLAGVAPYLVLSGGLGNFTEGVFEQPEARLFEQIALNRGVPADCIIVEDKSTNTGENCRFTARILQERGLLPLATEEAAGPAAAAAVAAAGTIGDAQGKEEGTKGNPPENQDRKRARFVLVQKPYMERRTLATVLAQWPEILPVAVTSPQLSLDTYPTREIPLESVVEIMVGDLQRIREYPSKGFQAPMDIPDEVWAAWEALAAAGFSGHLLKGTTLEPYRYP